jgi:hypothetical protein
MLSVAALSAVPTTIAPIAQADVCGDVGGRHVSVGGCTPGIAGRAAVDTAVAAGTADAVANDWARYGFPENYAYSLVPSFPGEEPCLSPTGLPYYTPADAPCYVP